MESNTYLFLFSALFLMIYYCNNHIQATISTNISTTDELALLALKSNLMNLDPSHILSQNWSVNSSSSVCSWVGVTCGRRHNRVIGLNISNMGLDGNLQLVPQLGNLSFLVSLDLSNNHFHGSLPQELTGLRRLRILNLNFNDFGGGSSIPSWFGTSFPRLQVFRLRNNTFNGIIPPSLSNLSKLEWLDMRYNFLYGEIPVQIGDLKNLRLLQLQGNQLTGSIPLDLFNISKLESLELSLNRLSGNLPNDICKGASRLEQFYLSGNEYSGNIPTNISSCSELRILSLSQNKFSGFIPREMGNIPALEMLYLEENNLTGEVPGSLFNISTLQIVRLGWNQLTGNLPSTLGYGLPNLEILVLSSNNFKIEVPELNFITSLSNCRNLRTLAINNNPLNGRLPSSIGNLSAMEYFYAYGSGLIGYIPPEIGNLSRLVTLTLFENELTGSLPDSMGNLENLQGLNLHQNKIHGAIPSTICKLGYLYGLVLSVNQIYNPIPDCIGNVTSLAILLLGDNKLNGNLPTSLWNLKDLHELDLSSNSFSGTLPPEIGNLKVSVEIHLSMNEFSGFIPTTIGNLISLSYLSLNQNKFQGPIPESISQMVSIEYLDLSHNNFSGKIPSALQKLQHLIYFNVSFNDLSGEIPSDGPFRNFSSQFFLANKGLCGDSKYNVSPCPAIPREKSKTKLKIIIMIITIPISLVVLFLGISYAFAKRKTEQVVSGRSSNWPIHTPLKFSYYELLEATESYAKSRLLGTGSFGSVYKATLRNGKNAAVKVFHLDSEEAYKSFEVECRISGELRHRNLCQVIGSCSNTDFKALVLEYMLNGSLEKWLYSNNFFLDLLQRINIMIDVAFALEYLHYGYSTCIVHCDLKPSNILLDENMIAHLSDFGISKLLDDGESVRRTMTLATMGYIAPEFGTDGLVSIRCDVYSYGILLMEVLTGRKPDDEMFSENLSLRSWVYDAISNGNIHIVTSKLWKPNEDLLNEKLDCVLSIFKLALFCSMESPSERTNIKDVRVALEKIKRRLQSYYIQVSADLTKFSEN